MQTLREKLLISDTFVLEETQKIQYLYKLKTEIRYASSRDGMFDSESVADHVYGMMVLTEYFLPLEDPQGAWDKQRIFDMILFHDIDEIETGDKIGYLKTKQDRARESEVLQKVIGQVPEAIREHVTLLLQECEAQETLESRFVKALDKAEPLFQCFNSEGKRIFHRNNTTYTQHRSIKDPYMKNFQVIMRFNEVISKEMIKQDFFTPEKE